MKKVLIIALFIAVLCAIVMALCGLSVKAIVFVSLVAAGCVLAFAVSDGEPSIYNDETFGRF